MFKLIDNKEVEIKMITEKHIGLSKNLKISNTYSVV